MADTAALPTPPSEKRRPRLSTARLRPWQWVALDGLVALLFLVPVGSHEQHGPAYQNPWLSVLVIAVTLVFLGRRRFPMTVFLLLTAATVTLASFPPPYNGYQPLAMMFALYTVATSRSGRVTALASGGFLTVALVILVGMRNSLPISVLSGGAIAVAPAVAGYAVRQQRLHHEAMAAEQAGKIEAEVTSRLAEERLRIARELHDVVAHALSLITVQAGVAVFREHEAEQMRQTLTGIEETGRTAMVDMRQLLGVLRGTPAPEAGATTASASGSASGSAQTQTQTSVSVSASVSAQASTPTPDLEPVPGLFDIGALISQTAQAGLRISLREEGERRPLPTAVGLAMYRIVQESLTNILRHARTTSGSVLLSFTPDAVAVTIANPPPPDGLPPLPVGPPGHGLRGMAERTALFGGTFRAEPTAAGGFVVTARFPA